MLHHIQLCLQNLGDGQTTLGALFATLCLHLIYHYYQSTIHSYS